MAKTRKHTVSTSIDTIQPGDRVRLRAGVAAGSVAPGRRNHRTSTVKALLSDTPGGLYLERDLAGLRYWNISDVERVPPGND